MSTSVSYTPSTFALKHIREELYLWLHILQLTNYVWHKHLITPTPQVTTVPGCVSIMDQLLQGRPVKPAIQLVRDYIFTLAPLIFVVSSEEFKQVRTCASQHRTMCMKLHAANLTGQNVTTVNHTCIHPHNVMCNWVLSASAAPYVHCTDSKREQQYHYMKLK